MANFIKHGAALCGVLALLVTAMFIMLYLITPSRPSAARPANRVTLHAASGNTSVQMFDALSPYPAITTFPDGWGCTKLGDRVTHDGMSFYKLNCGNKIGYVNAQWVR